MALCWGSLAGAQEGVSVTATVDRNQVGLGDVINLSLTISAQNSINVEEPHLPDMKGFELINTSSGVETRSTYANGRFITEQARRFSFMLAVQAKGTLTIPPINVNVDGKSYATRPITISASGQRSVPPRAQGPPGGGIDPFGMLDDADEEIFNQLLRRNLPGQGGGVPPRGQGGTPQAQNLPDVNPNEAFFIQAEVDKPRAYAGEQVVVNFFLYTRGQIRDIDTLKYPDLKGFWKEEIEMATRLNFEQVVVNGLPYSRALLVSYALFPIKAGTSTIDPYKAKCTVLTPSAFGFGRPYQFTKASRPISIEVKDIPVDGRPANFTGAIGRYRVTAQFEPPTGVTNQPVTLRVRFDGQGNAKLIELPKLDLPPSFELYDQKSQAKFLKDGSSYKEFEVLIIPREPGTFQIPPLAIAVFDPETGKFTTAASQPLSLTVTGAATPLAGQDTPKTSPDPGPKTPQPPPLATEIGSSASFAGGSMAGGSLGLTAALYVLVFGFLGRTAWRELRRKPKKVSLGLVLGRRLKIIRDLASKQEFRRVGVEMTNAAYYVLGQISERGGANQELALLLESTPPSLRGELAGPIEKLMNQCEALSFAPENVVGELKEKARLQALVAEFEKVMKRAIELAEV